MSITGFDGFHLCRLPGGGLWRVTSWDDPFDPPRSPPPIDEADPEIADAGRWDDPLGKFRTLYCATDAVGAVGEKLAEFGLNPEAVIEIGEFLETDPDDEFADDDLGGGLDARKVDELGWKLAWAPVDPAAEVIDITNYRTFIAAVGGLRDFLRHFGIRSFDRGALLGPRGAFTRSVAGYFRSEAAADNGSLRAVGLRYESRLPPSWECWALWEPLAIDPSEVRVETITIDTPELRSAAAMLGVPLLD
jgi:hypothetical protein